MGQIPKIPIAKNPLSRLNISTAAGRVRFICRVTSVEELLRLPECELIDVERVEVEANNTTTIFHCLHRDDYNCRYKVIAMQQGSEGQQFIVYVNGVHQHGEVTVSGSADKTAAKIHHCLQVPKTAPTIASSSTSLGTANSQEKGNNGFHLLRCVGSQAEVDALRQQYSASIITRGTKTGAVMVCACRHYCPYRMRVEFHEGSYRVYTKGEHSHALSSIRRPLGSRGPPYTYIREISTEEELQEFKRTHVYVCNARRGMAYYKCTLASGCTHESKLDSRGRDGATGLHERGEHNHSLPTEGGIRWNGTVEV